MNRPTRGLSSLWLPHKGLGSTTGCGGPGATGGRSHSQRHPHSWPLYSQEGALGQGPSIPTSGPAGTLSAKGGGQLSQSSGLSFPRVVIPGILPQPDVPSWYPPHLLSPTAKPTLHGQFPGVPSQGPLARYSSLTLDTCHPPQGQEKPSRGLLAGEGEGRF